MAKEKIFKLCGYCNGTGIVSKKTEQEVIEIQCPACLGGKATEWGYLEKGGK